MTANTLLLALVLFGEARGEGETGQRAVASVIWCRAGGDTARLRGVVTRRKQFSAYPACTMLSPWLYGPATRDGRAWQVSMRVAHEMTDGRFKPTINADHYHADYVQPRWAGKMQRVARVGHHIFYTTK